MVDLPPSSAGADGPSSSVVDVVIATRGNRPELLGSALDAVWGQTFTGRIVCTVVFDNAEPDQSLVRSTPQREIRVTTNTCSPGLAGARNSGVAAGSGELIAFCDDDDEWLPTKVERQVALLESTAALTSVTGIIVLYGDREVVRIPKPADMTVEKLVRSRVMEAHPSTVMVRRSAMSDSIGLVDELIPGSFAEDYDWIIRAAKAGSFAVVPEALVKVRWGGSMFSQNWQTIIDALDYLVAKHPEFSADPQALARIRGQRAFALAALGRRNEALHGVLKTLQTSPRERRAYVAAAVALRVVSARRVMDLAHKRGRGI